MCLKMFRPTPGKITVMIIFILAVFIPSSIFNYPNLQFDVISQLQLILLIPWLALNLSHLAAVGIAIWLVYLYIIVCIYTTAYTYIESSFRKEFPHMNDVLKKQKKKKNR